MQKKIAKLIILKMLNIMQEIIIRIIYPDILKLACEKNPYEAQNTLAFLFPEGMEVRNYYAYMKERLNINMTK